MSLFYRSMQPIFSDNHSKTYSYLLFLSDFMISDNQGMVLQQSTSISSCSLGEMANRFYKLGSPILQISDALENKRYDLISYVFYPFGANAFPVFFRIGHFQNSNFIARNLCRFFLTDGDSNEYKFAFLAGNLLLVFDYESERNHSIIMSQNLNFNDLDGLELFINI